MKKSEKNSYVRCINIEAMHLAKNLKFLLKMNNTSEAEIAKHLGIPALSIKRLTSGETTDPRISTLQLLSHYFSVSIDTLIGESSASELTLSNKSKPYFIPILEWSEVESGMDGSKIDKLNVQEWQAVVDNQPHSLSEFTYGLLSKPSMQPRFPLGTVFVIDPKYKPIDGDLVLLRDKENSISMRELVIDGAVRQLLPIIEGPCKLFFDSNNHKIIGTVMITFFRTNYKY